MLFFSRSAFPHLGLGLGHMQECWSCRLQLRIRTWNRKTHRLQLLLWHELRVRIGLAVELRWTPTSASVEARYRVRLCCPRHPFGPGSSVPCSESRNFSQFSAT